MFCDVIIGGTEISLPRSNKIYLLDEAFPDPDFSSLDFLQTTIHWRSFRKITNVIRKIYNRK